MRTSQSSVSRYAPLRPGLAKQHYAHHGMTLLSEVIEIVVRRETRMAPPRLQRDQSRIRTATYDVTMHPLRAAFGPYFIW